MSRPGVLLSITLLLGFAVASTAEATSPREGEHEPKQSHKSTSAQGLTGFLDADGRLALPRDFSGSLDPAGFEMVLDENNAPRFLAKGAAADADARWDDRFFLPSGCDQAVYAIAQGPAGEIYLGGIFTSCGGVAANGVVRYDPATGMWSALGSGGGNGVLGDVFALAVSGSDLFVGGSLFQANLGDGVSVNRVARWDGGTWSALGSGAGDGVNGTVRALALSGSDLYVGGDFTQANFGESIAANNIARWDGSAWSTLGSGAGNGVNGTVRALAASGSDLYAGGFFTEVNLGEEIGAQYIARWSDGAWSTLGSSGGNGVNNVVFALAASGSELYVGGAFTEANVGNPVPAGRIALWDGNTWSALGSGEGIGLSSNVLALVLSGSDLYAGGIFGQADVGGEAFSTVRVARWNGMAWSALGSGAGNGIGAAVYALGVSGSELYAGGQFTQANAGEPIAANRIARWDGSLWSTPGSGAGQGLNGTVRAVATSASGVNVGGSFTLVGGVTANNVALWDGSTWSALGSDGGNGVNGDVAALAMFDGELYAGGTFDRVNVGAPTPINTLNLARWNGSTWVTVGSVNGQGVFGPVLALAASDSALYVGGHFTHVESIAANRVARWDGSAWSALGSAGGNGVDNIVWALAVSGSELYVGGDFTRANQGADWISAYRVARWDGSTWSALGSNNRNGLDARVRALAVSGSDLYAGGIFREANCDEQILSCFGIPVNRVAHWDGSAWSALGSGAGNGVSSEVLTLALSGGNLFVGGLFTLANVGEPVPASHIARWDGSAWWNLGSGTSALVNVLDLSDPGTLYAGGPFRLAGNKPSSFFGIHDRADVYLDGFE